MVNSKHDKKSITRNAGRQALREQEASRERGSRGSWGKKDWLQHSGEALKVDHCWEKVRCGPTGEVGEPADRASVGARGVLELKKASPM